jgi:hypothetical protein
VDEEAAWRWLLKMAGRTVDPSCGIRHGQMTLEPSELFPGAAAMGPAARHLIELYLPLCRSRSERFDRLAVRVSAGLRPEVRRFDFGEDVLFECRFDG